MTTRSNHMIEQIRASCAVRALRRCTRLASVAFIGLLVLTVGSVYAQLPVFPVNPATLIFDNPDHASTTRYVIGYFDSATAPDPVIAVEWPRPETCTPCLVILAELSEQPTTGQTWYV